MCAVSSPSSGGLPTMSPSPATTMGTVTPTSPPGAHPMASGTCAQPVLPAVGGPQRRRRPRRLRRRRRHRRRGLATRLRTCGTCAASSPSSGGSDRHPHPVPTTTGTGTPTLPSLRPSTRIWYVRGQFTQQWGAPTMSPVPGDYDGDGDCRRRRLCAHQLASGTCATSSPSSGGLPPTSSLPGDYDGDGDTDVAVGDPPPGPVVRARPVHPAVGGSHRHPAAASAG